MIEAATHRCLWCGSAFKPRQSGGSVQRYCSTAHRIALHTAARKWAVREMEAGRLSVEAVSGSAPAAYTLVGAASQAVGAFRQRKRLQSPQRRSERVWNQNRPTCLEPLRRSRVVGVRKYTPEMQPSKTRRNPPGIIAVPKRPSKPSSSFASDPEVAKSTDPQLPISFCILAMSAPVIRGPKTGGPTGARYYPS